MKLIKEHIENVRYLTEKTEDGKKNLYIEGIFLVGDAVNRNNRMYKMDTLRNEVERYTEEYINTNRAFLMLLSRLAIKNSSGGTFSTQTLPSTSPKVFTWQIRFVHMRSLTLLNEFLMSFITFVDFIFYLIKYNKRSLIKNFPYLISRSSIVIP